MWKAALGANVEDVDGNIFVDLTAGFAVSTLGHRHPRVVAAVRAQQDLLLHAMGDAWPDATRIKLLAKLASVAPGNLSVSILGLSGSDAIDATVKTALLATGRTGVLTFGGGYHGLSLGAVPLQAYKRAFSEPFAAITHPDVRSLPFGAPASEVRQALAAGDIGLVLVEPLQGRGGMRVPPPGWLSEVASLTRAAGALLAFDEIQSGLGRTGRWWACEHEGVMPDLLCVGKALGGGFPLSACVGTPEVMAAWGASTGEAISTQTFLGHPVGCAAALASLEVMERTNLPARAAAVGASLTAKLTEAGFPVHGRGLMLGVKVARDASGTLAVWRELLQRGYIVLPAGAGAEVLGLTPPVVLSDAQQAAFVHTLVEVCP